MSDLKPGGPEWWTTENTEAWHRHIWGDRGNWDSAMRIWGYKLKDALPRAGAACYRPLPLELMAKWRETDPRPPHPTFYDGRPQPYIRRSVGKVRKPRKVRVAA